MNQLAKESSTYLLQHAEQPVNWWPWGEAALQRARTQERPILLSIGYSACHWCHVMAHESFADPAIAEILNKHFVCIKVDREERPDIDQIYQAAHQMLTQRAGGWPLTLFLTPAGQPFYGATYYPAKASMGLPAFSEVLSHVAHAWSHQGPAIHARAEQISTALRCALQPEPVSAPLDKHERQPIRRASATLLNIFDPRYGGFGAAPKFPHPTELQLLLYIAQLQEDDNARHAALHSLRKMAEGGLCDQLGGGFFRYSTDAGWEIPHFEKMLPDNALLLWLYSEAFALSAEPLFRRCATDLVGWALRELRSPAGLFYSALDADTGSGEGAYYLWDKKEFTDLLNGERLALACAHFGLDDAPKFENRAWHLRIWRPLEEVAATLAIPPVTARQHIDVARARLLSQRETRPHPGRDSKILCGANALMIRALARAASVFGQPEWLQHAQRAIAVLREDCRVDGRLYACPAQGSARLNASLDDHAYLLEACLELLQADFRCEDLNEARWLADQLLEHFEDTQQGGFYFTRHDHESLIARARTAQDNAAPSGNGVAARCLLRLGYLLGETRYLLAAERCLQAFSADLERAGPSLLLAFEEWLAPPTLLILRGERVEAQAWQARLLARNEPQLMVFNIPKALAGLPICLDKPCGSGLVAWVCRGHQCLPPVASYEELLPLLRPEPDYLLQPLLPEQ